MKSEILSCPHNDIYFLETNDKSKDTNITNVFASNLDKQTLKCKQKRKLKSKFHPILEFFAGNEMGRGSATAAGDKNHRHFIEKNSSMKASSSSSSSSENLTKPTRTRRNSIEMYKEAATILGLTCSQTDDCRCLDCQCHYFDYDEEIDLDEESDYLMDHVSACSIQ